MPYEIEHIDAIARKLQRDVLFVVFHAPTTGMSDQEQQRFDFDTRYDWKASQTRSELIGWLDAKGFEWTLCGHVANTSMMISYRGQIYIDLPYDTSSAACLALCDHLEFPDGTMRFPDATLCLLQLHVAMTNAEHDEPGFWDRWADKF